jgi:AcrR family transcriptional regulator
VTEQKPDPTGAKILDGATRVLGDFGFKRATVELVANYAGVSHMTIYRRWPTKNDLLKTAMIGEFTTLLDTAFDHGDQRSVSFADRALAAFTNTVWAVQNHPLALRELNSDSSEQSPMQSATSTAVMEASVPLVADFKVLAQPPKMPRPTWIRSPMCLSALRIPSSPSSDRASR